MRSSNAVGYVIIEMPVTLFTLDLTLSLERISLTRFEK